MKIKFGVEETVSEGLDKLQEEFQAELEDILTEMAYQATGREEDESAPIPKLMGKMNPWLFISGQLESARTFEIGERKSKVIINYSGMRYDEWYTEEEFRPWWEFAENFESYTQYAILERDYALFQETGRDDVASPHDARHKFAIEWGMREAARPMRTKLRAELGRVLNKM